MENKEILLKPAIFFAFLLALPLVLLSMSFLLLAWYFSPWFLFISLGFTVFAWYKFLYTMNLRYVFNPEFIRVIRRTFFKRNDQVEMYHFKDYTITQSFVFQIFGLMNLILKGTDPKKPVVYLRGIPASDITDISKDYVQGSKLRKSNIGIS